MIARFGFEHKVRCQMGAVEMFGEHVDKHRVQARGTQLCKTGKAGGSLGGYGAGQSWASLPFDIPKQGPTMREMRSKILLIPVCVWLLAFGLAKASDEVPQELIGTWDYISLTIPSGATVHFKPGQWTLKLNADKTWVMEGLVPKHWKANGAYEVHGSKLKLNGGNDLEYHFSLKRDGKVLELKDKSSKISASRE
ncbi:MAG: hypothetical protein WA555_04505 [Candidatus Sulfotelmatobacter sp.]